MLLAQIAYRRGDFLQALETYRALLPDVGDDGRNDIVANMLACAVSAASAAEAQGEPRAQAAGVVSGVLREAGVRGDESSEVAFNLACAALLQGDLAAAADKLEAARTLGLEALSEVRQGKRAVAGMACCWAVSRAGWVTPVASIARRTAWKARRRTRNWRTSLPCGRWWRRGAVSRPRRCGT